MVTPRRRGLEYTVAHLPGVGRGELLVVTNDRAIEFRLMLAPVATSTPESWVEVVPEAGDVRLHDVDVFARHVVLSTVSAGQQLLRILPRAALQRRVSLDLQSARVDRGWCSGRASHPLAQRGA